MCEYILTLWPVCSCISFCNFPLKKLLWNKSSHLFIYFCGSFFFKNWMSVIYLIGARHSIYKIDIYVLCLNYLNLKKHFCFSYLLYCQLSYDWLFCSTISGSACYNGLKFRQNAKYLKCPWWQERAFMTKGIDQMIFDNVWRKMFWKLIVG